MTGKSGYNLGHPGIGVYEHLQILVQHGMKRRPQLVLMNYYEGNDLRDAILYENYRSGIPQAPRDTAKDRLEQLVQQLSDIPVLGESYAVNLLLAGAVKVTVKLTERPAADFRYTLTFAESVAVAFNLENTDLDEVAHAKALKARDITLDSLVPGLARFVELSQRNGFQPVVMYTPSAYSAYADYVQFNDIELAELMPWYSRIQRDFLAAQGAALGFRVVDVTPALQAAARRFQDESLLYFPTNVHLTQLGHRVIAEALAQELRLELINESATSLE